MQTRYQKNNSEICIRCNNTNLNYNNGNNSMVYYNIGLSQDGGFTKNIHPRLGFHCYDCYGIKSPERLGLEPIINMDYEIYEYIQKHSGGESINDWVDRNINIYDDYGNIIN